MRLNNTQLGNFIGRIKLKKENMPKFRVQVSNLLDKLETKIKDDKRTGLRVTKRLIAGSWKKGTILRPTGEHPIDVDLILFIEGDNSVQNDLKKLHDFIVEYLEEIYPTKDISRDVDAEGNTKSITLTFVGTGLQVDVVPVIPTENQYVIQPQRGGGGKKYITSVDKQLSFARDRKINNSSYTSIVRAIKWWRNYKELNPIDDEGGLSSFAIELIVSYLDITKGIETSIENGIIRFFKFLSDSNFPIIKFNGAINSVPKFDTAIFVGDPTNNENNAAKKTDKEAWKEIVKEANIAFETLCIAQSKNNEGDTIEEWKSIFKFFNITEEA